MIINTTFVRIIFETIMFYMLIVCGHYAAAYAYTQYCVPWGMVGLMKSVILAATPQCVALRWTIYHAGQSIIHMWMAVGMTVIRMFNVHLPRMVHPVLV